jgi:GT2 family glycosyltransferase
MSTVTTKRSILLEYPFNSFFRRAEDYDLLMRLAKRGYKFHYIDHPLIKYRRHEGSITKEKKMLFNYGRMVKNNYQVVKDE